MSIGPFQSLACPLDGIALHPHQNTWRCTSGHSFDIASQGYTHLLPVQHKRSRDPGDSQAMVAARRRFLDTGVYRAIADVACRAVLADAPVDEVTSCLDAGCGEGYYLRQLASAADQEGRKLSVLGLDISKWAVLAAAKKDRRMNWVVGSNANLPVLSGTLDRILCMFGFPVYGEFARVLKRGGQLLQADAGPTHLRELREIIYPTLKPEKPAATQAPPGFALLATENVSEEVRLESAAQIADLLAMTPHLFRATVEGKARVAELTRLTLTMDIRVSRFRRVDAR